MGKLDMLDATTPQQQPGPYVGVVVAELMYSIRLRLRHGIMGTRPRKSEKRDKACYSFDRTSSLIVQRKDQKTKKLVKPQDEVCQVGILFCPRSLLDRVALERHLRPPMARELHCY